MAEETIGVSDGRPGEAVPGKTLGPYRIDKQIGRGGMSVVYQAIHVPLERTVALKVLLPSLSGDQDFVDRFLAEAKAAARLDYPHIVPIYDSGEINGVNYIAMKLLEGHDLKSVLEQRREAGTAGLPLDRAISIASQTAGALEFAHKHQLVHRDIKPANINVDENDRVTVVDFGIARALDRASSTLTGTVIGTPTYMSPEQAQGKAADYRSDIYSLGIVLYEMLTGAPPFSGQPQTVMYAHVFNPPPPIENVKADLPPGIGEVVQRALAKAPEARYQSAGELALALTSAAGGQLSRNALGPSTGSAYYTESPSRVTGTAGGPDSGPHTAMPGGITHGTLQQPATAEPYARPAKKTVPLGAILGLGGAVLAALAAVLVWAFLAGPLAGDKYGEMIVNSDPQGATVTLDGNPLGVTPYDARQLKPGTHELILEKASYAQVKRTEKFASGDKDRVNAELTPLPADELVDVKSSFIAIDPEFNPDGSIKSFGQTVSTFKAGQDVYFVVRLLLKDSVQRDLVYNYEFDVQDPTGSVILNDTHRGTITRSEPDQTFTGHLQTRPAAPDGTYKFRFVIDNKEVAAKTLGLVK
ncbi:MAG: serine/threonine-protein kinase [Dehalococcoidia bacterium]